MCAHLQLQQIQRYQRYYIEDELTRVHIMARQLPVIIYLVEYNCVLLAKGSEYLNKCLQFKYFEN